MSKSIILILLLIGSILAPSLPLLGLPVASAQSSSPILSIQIVPPSLPADGRTYESIVVVMRDLEGKPKIASEDVQVSLTSSRTSVGRVSDILIIPSGESYAVAEFQSSLSEGSTTITVSAEGFQSGSSIVSTLRPAGTPVRFSVHLAPQRLLPDEGTISSVIVQLIDARGSPARAATDILVSLSSSDISVGRVDNEISIKAGQTFGKGRFYGSFLAGSTRITASASGYATGSNVMQVSGPVPASLAIFASPPRILSDGEESVVVVQLQDPSGVPAIAPSDIEVSLFSSNSALGTIDETILIRAGESYSSAIFTSAPTVQVGNTATSIVGLTTLTALASGFSTGSANIDVVDPAIVASGVGIFLSPPVLRADVGSHRSVVVQLLDSAGTPVLLNSSTPITLSSLRTYVGIVEPFVVIPPGRSYTIATFESTFTAGTTTITAAAPGLQTGVSGILTSGPLPETLAISAYPPTLPADGMSHEALLIELQDSSGVPSKAPSDVEVTLTSSSPEIGKLTSEVIIPSGKTHAIVNFQTTTTSGSTMVTATTSGYSSGSVQVLTVEPYPSRLILYPFPLEIPADGLSRESVIVQLQDAGGAPAEPQQRVAVQLYSSNPSVGRIEALVTILPGETFAVASFNSTGRVGETVITAISQGFITGEAMISTFVLPLSLSIGIPVVELALGGETIATVTVTTAGGPLSNVAIAWSAIGVQIISSQVTTDENGRAVARVGGLGMGEATVTAKATKLSYGPSSANANLVVTDTESQGLLGSVSTNLLLIGGTAMPLTLLGIWGVMKMKKKRKRNNNLF